MSYYIKYTPAEDVHYLPEAWKAEEYFPIDLSRNHIPPCEWKGGGAVKISEADMIEADVLEWYRGCGGEMTEFDREFIARLRKEEAEWAVGIDMKAIEKTYRVNLARREMADAELREHWARVDASVGRWIPLGEGKYVWENYKEGEGGKSAVPIKKPVVKKVPVKKKPEAPAGALAVPLPITRVEVTLGGNDIVIELTSASDIPTILEGLKEQYGFSEKMKKKLDVLLSQNKPT